MPFKIVRNDLTRMKTEAIVNAANVKLQKGGGVCGAIFAAAGVKELEAACQAIGGCNVGEAVITPGYKLDAKYIIHTVGPIWQGGGQNEEELLYQAYQSALHVALAHDVESIAFPLISAGIYGFPKDKAMNIAISAISDFLFKHEMTIYLVVYEKDVFLLSEKLFTDIKEYIDDHYVEEEIHRRIEPYELRDTYYAESRYDLESRVVETDERSLEDVLNEAENTFSEMLLRLIDEKGITDVQAYKNANVDRRLFSKIRSDKDYRPSKETAIAFAISLELNLDETRDLLKRAGYALSPSNKFDLIIRFFIEEGNYNIFEMNEALFSFDQKTLGV